MNGSLTATTRALPDSKAALVTKRPILPNPLTPMLNFFPSIVEVCFDNYF